MTYEALEALIARLKAQSGDFRRFFTAQLADGTRRSTWGDVISTDEFNRICVRLMPPMTEAERAKRRALNSATSASARYS